MAWRSPVRAAGNRKANNGFDHCRYATLFISDRQVGDAFKRLNFTYPGGVRRYALKSGKFLGTSLMPATYAKVVVVRVDAVM